MDPKAIITAKDGTKVEVFDGALLGAAMIAVREHNAAVDAANPPLSITEALSNLGFFGLGRSAAAGFSPYGPVGTRIDPGSGDTVTWDADRLRTFGAHLGKPATAAIRHLVDASDPVPSADVAKVSGLDSPKALGPILGQVRTAAARLRLPDPIIRKRDQRGARCLAVTPEFKTAALRARQPDQGGQEKVRPDPG